MSAIVTSPGFLIGESLLLMPATILLITCVVREVKIHQVIGRTSLQRTLARIDTTEPSHDRVFDKKLWFCLFGERCLKLAHIFVIQQVNLMSLIQDQYMFGF